MSDVPLTTWIVVPAVAPKWTAVAAAKPAPVSVTVVFPVVGPVAGVTLVTVGRLAVYTKWSVGALVGLRPPVLVTWTSTVAAAWSGLWVVILVALVTWNVATGVVPNVTAVVWFVKAVPVIVTAVPPVVGPVAGVTFVTVARGPAAAEGATVPTSVNTAPSGARNRRPVTANFKDRITGRLLISFLSILRCFGWQLGKRELEPRPLRPDHALALPMLEVKRPSSKDQTAVFQGFWW